MDLCVSIHLVGRLRRSNLKLVHVLLPHSRKENQTLKHWVQCILLQVIIIYLDYAYCSQFFIVCHKVPWFFCVLALVRTVKMCNDQCVSVLLQITHHILGFVRCLNIRNTYLAEQFFLFCWSKWLNVRYWIYSGILVFCCFVSFSTATLLFSDELPKQAVVNLLDDYGFDPNDRFPSKFQGRAAHERSKSIVSAIEMQSQASSHHQRAGTSIR